ncbi:MAG: hypothetical protein P8K80_05130 [Phycisphaerales bacterium]|jgi:hypothetical protein|nr:hypothetical protein [Phycisphaerales bacterium]
MKGLTTVKSWARELIDLLLVFIVLGVLVQIIFGTGDLDAGIPYFGDVVANLIDLVKQLGQAGVVGLIALLVIVGLYSGRTTS